jgi:hypothetical protein
MAAPGKTLTVAVVDVSVTVSSTVQVTAGSDVEQLMFGVVPLPTTKFVPVTPTVKPSELAVRLPTAVTAEMVGPATIAMVPEYVSRPSVKETGTLAAAGVPGATLIGKLMDPPVLAVEAPNVTPAVVELAVQSVSGSTSGVAWLKVKVSGALFAPAPTGFRDECVIVPAVVKVKNGLTRSTPPLPFVRFI